MTKHVKMTTSAGELRIELDDEKAHNARLAAKGISSQYFVDLLDHEATHSDQWARYDSWAGFAVDYAVESAKSYASHLGGEPDQYLPADADQAMSDRNRFEVGANLYWGGYLCMNEYHVTTVGPCADIRMP